MLRLPRPGHQAFAPVFNFLEALMRFLLGGPTLYHADVVLTSNLSGTYANGSSGVGATLTKASAGALGTQDGVTPFLNMLTLLTAQSPPAQNGYYRLTRVGDSSTAWQMTRVADFDASADMVRGTVFHIRLGTTHAGKTYSYTAASSPTVGTTALTFAEDAAARTATPQTFDNKTFSTIVYAAATELTIASGVVTATQGAHTIDTEADAASDDLDTINGLTAEGVYRFRPSSGARTVVVKHGTGNIICPDARDITLADATDEIVLVYRGGSAVVVAVNTLVPRSVTPAQVRTVTLSAATEAGNAIVVTGQLADREGNAVASAQRVVIETFAPTAAKGTITVTDGTQVMNTGAPAGKTSTAVVLTDADGTFAFSVADDQVENVLVRCTVANGLPAQVGLAFA